MSIHEKSLLAHEPLSGFQPGLDAVAEDTEVHVASAVDRRRASVAPGVDGVAESGFQAASTSCLFTVDEAAPRDEEEEASTMPPSTASPSNESSTATTVASSIVDVTAPPEEAARPPPPKAPGVQWLTESEPATVVTAAPPQQQQVSSCLIIYRTVHLLRCVCPLVIGEELHQS